jgi:8-oxo-dGTP diphosphatase
LIEVTAAIIVKDSKFLICQRPKGKACELLWEFPGGKIEAGETGEECIVREIQEELGVTLRVLRKLTDVVYEYPDRVVHLHFFITEIASGELTRKEHNALAWITSSEIHNYQFCPADATMLCRTDLSSIAP